MRDCSALNRPMAWIVVALCLPVVGAGCDRVDVGNQWMDESRLARGLVVILPGIEGESASNHDIRRGLDEAGVPYALAIYRWGHPVPGIGMFFNQTDVEGNRRSADELADRIITYQANNPNRPIFLIGHSAGGGMAVFVLEAMGRKGATPIDGAFLLSSSLSANYPLNAALRMTRRGIVNVYNPEDDLLDGGTATFGNVDGGRGASAGRTGFDRKYPNVFESRITSAETGIAGGPHFIATNANLIGARAPRWLKAKTWPPEGLD